MKKKTGEPSHAHGPAHEHIRVEGPLLEKGWKKEGRMRSSTEQHFPGRGVTERELKWARYPPRSLVHIDLCHLFIQAVVSCWKMRTVEKYVRGSGGWWAMLRG